METGSKRSSSAQSESSSRPGPKRSVSKASLKAQARIQHNEEMTDRYFSGVSSQEHLPVYNTTITTRSNSVASIRGVEEELELKENTRVEWRDAHALTTQGHQAIYAQGHGWDEADPPQRVHEIV